MYHTWHNVENWVSYSNKKIGQQIAGYKVEMCKSMTTIKPCHCQAFKKVPMGRVMLHRQWNWISSGVCFLAFCSLTQPFAKKDRFWSIFLFSETFHEIFIFLAKTASKSKILENRPYLKFNFTFCTTSPYPLGSFLKLGNGIVWFWSYFYTFLPCNQQFAAQFSYCCNSLNFQHYVFI